MCAHTCMCTQQGLTGCRAFPALHLSGSTCCGINPVDCCPREVEGWAFSTQAFVCSSSSQSQCLYSSLVIHPRQTEQAHNSQCPLGRYVRVGPSQSLRLWFLFNEKRELMGTSKVCPQNPNLPSPCTPCPPHSLPSDSCPDQTHPSSSATPPMAHNDHSLSWLLSIPSVLHVSKFKSLLSGTTYKLLRVFHYFC